MAKVLAKKCLNLLCWTVFTRFSEFGHQSSSSFLHRYVCRFLALSLSFFFWLSQNKYYCYSILCIWWNSSAYSVLHAWPCSGTLSSISL